MKTLGKVLARLKVAAMWVLRWLRPRVRWPKFGLRVSLAKMISQIPATARIRRGLEFHDYWGTARNEASYQDEREVARRAFIAGWIAAEHTHRIKPLVEP